MFNFLNTLISIMFIYFILSLVASSIQEVIASIFKLRARNLEKWLIETFKEDGCNLGEIIKGHPVVKGLSHHRNKRIGSYLPSNEFVTAFLDTIVHNSENGNTVGTYDVAKLKGAIEKTPFLKTEMKNYLLQTIQDTGHDLYKIREEIALWFDKANERIMGSYKRNTRYIILVTSFLLCGLANVDTIELIHYFNANQQQASAVAKIADAALQDSTIIKNVESIHSIQTDSLFRDSVFKESFNELKGSLITKNEQYMDIIATTKVPLGWDINKWEEMIAENNIFSKIIGILLTAFAVSLGAPFWFDLLNKISNLRSSGSLSVGQKK